VGTKGGEVDSELRGAGSESGGGLSSSDGGEDMFVVGVEVAKVTWGTK
jgi:hypothetical protein